MTKSFNPSSPEFQGFVASLEEKYQLPPGLVASVVHQESRGKPEAVSGKGARGLMQLMPETAKNVGVKDPHDPYQNVEGGAAYLAQLLKQYKGNEKAALAHYNGGTSQGKLVAQGKEPTYAETRDYVKKVGSQQGSPAKTGGPAPAGGQGMESKSAYNKEEVQKGVLKAIQSGVSADDILARLAERPDTAARTKAALAAGASAQEIIEAAGGPALAAFRQQQKDVEAMPWYQKAAAGAGSRVEDLWLGGKQLVGKATTQEVEEKRARDAALMESGWAKAGSFVPDAAASLLVPGAGGAGLLARLGARALGGAAVEGALGGLEARGEGESRGEAALTGAATGAVGGALSVPAEAVINKVVVNPLAKTLNTARGKVSASPEGMAYKAAKREGIELTPAQLGSATGEFAERVQRYIPGVAAHSERKLMSQQEAVKDAIGAIGDDFISPARQAQSMEPSEAVVESLNRARNEAKKAASKKFDDVARIAATEGTTPIRPSSLRTAALEQKDNLQDIFNKFGLTKLKGRIDEVVKGTAPQQSPILQSTGQPFTKPMEMSFDEARAFRSELGEAIRAAEKSSLSGSTTESEVGALKQLFKGLEKDLDAWGQNNPSVKSAWDDARKAYKEDYVQVFKEPGNVRRMLKPDFDPDRIISSSLSPQHVVKSRNLINALDREGHQSVRDMLVQRATSMVEEDPIKAGKELRKLSGKEYYQIFSPEERARFSTLADAVDTTYKNKSPFKSGLDTSRLARKLGGPTAGAAGLAAIGVGAGVPAAIASGVGVGGTALLLNSPLARRAMLAPGSEALSPILRKMMIQKPGQFAGIMGAQATGSGQMLSELLRQQMQGEQ